MRVTLLLTLLMLAPHAIPQDTSGSDGAISDGNWWYEHKSTDESGKGTIFAVMKTAYVRGFLDTAAGAVIDASTSARLKTEDAKPCFALLRGEAVRYFSKISSRQMIDGLDQFYSDFRNRRISIGYAFFIVAHQIAGDDPARIEEMIANAKRGLAPGLQ